MASTLIDRKTVANNSHISKGIFYMETIPTDKNSKEIVELLISKGADINAKDIIYQIIKILFFINII